MKGMPYRTPMQRRKHGAGYPFLRKSVEARALSDFATVLDHVVRHPEVAPRLKLKGAKDE